MLSRFEPRVNVLRLLLKDTQGPDLIEALARGLEAILLPALAADSSGRYIAANGQAQRLTGYSSGELLRMSVMDLTPVRSGPDGATLWTEFMSKGVQEGTYDVRRKDGTSVRVRYWAFANVAPDVHLSFLRAQETAVA